MTKTYRIERYIVSKYGKQWLVCYAHKPDYCVSAHDTVGEAKRAARRYVQHDHRFASEPSVVAAAKFFDL